MSRETVVKLAEKWYKAIGFPRKFDCMFEKLIAEESDLQTMAFSDYDIRANGKGKNFIMFLYFCEELSDKYNKVGISREILMATIDDFIISAEREYALTKSLGLVKAGVLKNHLDMRLFRIGRLQFCMDGAPRDIPEKGIAKGENVIDVHIPAGDSLSIDECERDFEKATEFFAEYFPEFEYNYYTCFSWMLDKTLKDFLGENSNILKFQKLFDVVYEWENDSILNFVFKYGIASREELKSIKAVSSFAAKVKEFALEGGKFYNTLGVRGK